MPKPVCVTPKDSSTVCIKYSDGISGEVDLRKVIKRNNYIWLEDPQEFDTVCIDGETGDLRWNCGITMCTDALYRQIELQNLIRRLKIDIDKTDK